MTSGSEDGSQETELNECNTAVAQSTTRAPVVEHGGLTAGIGSC